MKHNRILLCAVVTLLCVSIVLLGSWFHARNDHSDLEDRCRYSAGRAHSRFADYRENRAMYDYRYGISELVSFYNAYMNLATRENGATDPNCMFLNRLVGVLMDMPELTDEQLAELSTAMDLLEDNIYDANAYHSICNVYHGLTS